MLDILNWECKVTNFSGNKQIKSMFFLRIPKKYRIFAKKLKKRYLKVKLKYEGPMYEGCTKDVRRNDV